MMKAMVYTLSGAVLGALAVMWLGERQPAPLPDIAGIRFEIEEPEWAWWPANAPRCPPLDMRPLPPARPL
jgi:hypothetical protein